jgi:hypothetical protein
MPSPFPGMDPYLEGEMWQEFHERLAHAISAQLMPRIAPKYVALLAKRYVLDQPGLAVFDLPRPRTVYPDVHVVVPAESRPEVPQPSAVTIDAPAVELANYIETPQLSVEIRDVAQRRLVTIIEILSPANKEGDGADEYHDRRRELLRSTAHLLELDLVRRGRRIVLAETPPAALYYIYLSRANRRPYTQIWLIGLRQRLPTVPVPLLAEDPDTYLDLQAALNSCFELVGYERLLDYTAPPPPPAFALEDGVWLEETLRAAGLRAA